MTAAERERAALTYSVAGRIGKALEPATSLCGFDWRTNIALFGGVAAKELVVGVMGTVYAVGQDPESEVSLSRRLAADAGWTPLKGFVLMLFVMLYAPCFVTLTVIARESKSWKWAVVSLVYSTAIAYAVAVAVFQAGRLIGLDA